MIGLNKKLIAIVENISSRSNNNDINVNMQSSFRDEIAFDSLNEVELIVELEDAFNIHIPDDFADEISSKVDCLNDLLPILKDKYGIFDIREERKEKIIEIEKK